MMTRPRFRRALRVESLESRELLTSGGPSAQQQYMLDLLNQARTNPAEMAQEITSNLSPDVQATINYYHVDLNQVKQAIASTPAQPPLAWNDQLASAAQGHSQDQANTGVQSHTGSDGSNLDDRLDQAGYTNRSSSGENAFAYSESVDEAMEAFLIDWGVSSNGHRNNILQPSTPSDQTYRDVGIGIVSSNRPGIGPEVITQDFGSQQGEKAQLLGVVYNDPGHTHSYQPGEGQGGVTIDATNESTGQSTSVQTWDSGGYQLPLDPGTYKVTALVGNQVVRSQDVTIGSQNVKVDYDLSDPWQPATPPPPPPAPPAPAPAPAMAPVPIATTSATPTVVTNAVQSTDNSTSLTSNTNDSTPPVVVNDSTPPVVVPIAPSSPAGPDTSFLAGWSSWTAKRS